MSDITFDLNHGPGNPRNSEGAFLRTSGRRIRFVYSRYTGDEWYDGAAADIAEVYSDDNGETWHDRGVIVPRGSADNIMSVSLLRLAPNDVRMFYLEKRPVAHGNCGDNVPDRPDGDDGRCGCVPYMRRSADDGETWGEAQRIIPFDEYYILNNDRVIRLASGRIIMPCGIHLFRTNGRQRGGLVFTLYSDDLGKTWKESDTVLCPSFQADWVYGFQEPGMIELEEGHLLLWIRTNLGYQFTSHSYDDGVTWGAAIPNINFPAPTSPLSMKRDPETGILYAIWNDTDRRRNQVLPHPQCNGRTPLAIMRSCDNGKTWERDRVVLLERDPERGYCYTAMEFLGGGELLLAYCHGVHRPLDGRSNLQDLRIRKINVNELWKD